ncbi:MAG: S1 RNA-binding domain-containing protein [Bradymonadales bacterium]|nr:S1 RNA-binding domain-containing protein [Bradymonadales bacterium]
MTHPLVQHLKRTASLTDAILQRLDGQAVSSALLESRLPDIPPGTLQTIVDGWMDWRAIQAIAPDLVGTATFPACVEALAERDKRHPAEPDLMELEAAVRQAMEKGSVCGRASRKDHPGLVAYAPHLDHVEFLGEISAHRWLALERGCADGVLRLEYRWPDELEAQARVLPLLPRCIARTLHLKSRSEATWAGAEVLIDLVTSPPRKEPLVAVARSGSKVSLAGVEADGRVVLRKQGTASEAEALIRSALDRHPVSTLVLAAGDRELGSLTWPRNLAVVFVRDVALHQASRALPGPRLEGLAIALAQRAQDPRNAWSRLDPTTLGLVEYQQNLDPEYARLVLSLALLQAEQRPDRVEAPRTAPGLTLVNAWEDLRPGMLVSGTVTQIAPFGAFVNIGVGTEALIHISQLADTRVARPTDAVHVGQRVTAKVIEIDRDRGRISLSLRSAPPRAEHRDGSRKKALDALDKLFKK